MPTRRTSSLSRFTALALVSMTMTAFALCEPHNIMISQRGLQAAPETQTVLDSRLPGSQTLWKKTENYENNLLLETKIYQGQKALVISGQHKKSADTGFQLNTIPLRQGLPHAYHIQFMVAANFSTGGFTGFKDRYSNLIRFLDADGKTVGTRTFSYDAPAQGYARISLTGTFPPKATALSLQFGADRPDFRKQDVLAYANLTIRYLYQQGPWAPKAGFTSGIFPLKTQTNDATNHRIHGDLTGAGAKVRFQIAVASEQRGFPTTFSAFHGPDGKPDSWFHNGAPLPAFPPATKWIRYRAQLLSSTQAPAVLNSVTVAGNRDANWKSVLDVTPPNVALASNSPTPDGAQPVQLTITDDSGIDWTSLAISLDDADITNHVYKAPQGLVFQPQTPLPKGLHRFHLHLKDLAGNQLQKDVFLFIGPKVNKGIVTLRHDGITLVDGKPFFPIGIYNVQECKANGHDLDRAFRELKDAGFNLAQTYRLTRDGKFQKFLAAAQKYGFKLWLSDRHNANDADLSRIARDLVPEHAHPSLLAWYIGDDTLTYNSPEQLTERTQLVKAVAPHLITVHADSPGSKPVSRYRPFVRTSLAFMPEIYPVAIDGKPEDCAAKVAWYMRRCHQDIRDTGSAPRTIWPIIQYFKGWQMWERFPTVPELRAMSYAALVTGAHGIVWYTYTGYGKNYGVSSTPERWKNITTLSREIADLTPVLTSNRNVPQRTFTITDGPRTNGLHDPAVATMTRHLNGKTYLFAVNTTNQAVRGTFDTTGLKGGHFLYPTRPLALHDHTLTCDLAPFDVIIAVLDK